MVILKTISFNDIIRENPDRENIIQTSSKFLFIQSASWQWNEIKTMLSLVGTKAFNIPLIPKAVKKIVTDTESL